MSSDSQVQAMLFEGLMRLEPDGSLTCAQAECYTQSADLKTYTFHLKETFWSNGTPVTAYDFEKTWKTHLDPSFPSPDTHALFCIKHAKAAKMGTASSDDIGIKAPDHKTLIVELERPTPYFLHIAASSILFPINHTQDQISPDWYLEASPQFICNGPFVLTSWKHHHEMLLVKNSYYRLADQIKLDSILIQMITSGIARLHMHASGFFDIVGLPLSHLPHDLYREMLKRNLLHVIPTPGTMACMFNTSQFPFQNVNIRKAFSYAINRQHIVNAITLTKEKPALGMIPPQFKTNNKQEHFRDYDIKNAQLCFQRGLSELGVSLQDLRGKLTFSFWKHDHCCPQLPQFLRDQWEKELGVSVELEALDFKTLHEKAKNGNFSMGYFVPISMYNDPIEILDRFKYSHNPRNYPRWEHPTFIELLDLTAEARTQEEHLTLLNRADALLMQEMPFAPVFHWNYALLVQPHVHGFSVSPLGFLYFDRMMIIQ